MKLFKLSVLTIFLLFLAVPLNAGVVTNEKVDEPVAFFVDCANDGVGEWVSGDLRLHVVVKDHMDKAGGFHYGFHFQPMGGVLFGETTGITYRANGVTKEGGYIGLDYLPFTVSFVDNLIFTTPGQAPNLKVKTREHITINGLGEVSVYFYTQSIICE